MAFFSTSASCKREDFLALWETDGAGEAVTVGCSVLAVAVLAVLAGGALTCAAGGLTG